jgi:hypothetical protein
VDVGVQQETLSTHNFTLEGLPDDCAVLDIELGQTGAGENFALGNIKRIHNGDNEVAAGTRALYISKQLAGDQLVHVTPKVRRM